MCCRWVSLCCVADDSSVDLVADGYIFAALQMVVVCTMLQMGYSACCVADW